MPFSTFHYLDSHQVMLIWPLLLDSATTPDKAEPSRTTASTNLNRSHTLSQYHSDPYNPRWLPRATLLICLLSLVVTSHVLYRFEFELLEEIQYFFPQLVSIYAIWFALNVGLVWTFTLGCLVFLQDDLGLVLPSQTPSADFFRPQSTSSRNQTFIHWFAWNITIATLVAVSACFIWLWEFELIQFPALSRMQANFTWGWRSATTIPSS